MQIEDLKFDAQGLIPAVVVDSLSRKVLTVAYMNRESLQISMQEGRTCFWSRSRQQLWRKGETSGNVQHIVSIVADCDQDALVVVVQKDGPACHTGEDSCFHCPLYSSQEYPDFTVDGLMELIRGRKTEKKEGSYTTYLFEKGLDKILKKVGEECAETIIAAKNGVKEDTVGEISDLIYHLTVMMVEQNIPLDDVLAELDRRSAKIGNLKQFHVSDHNT